MSLSTALIADLYAAPPFAVQRFTVDEYRRMGESGILTEDHRVELLDGWIVPKMNLSPPHSVSVKLCEDRLTRLMPHGFHTRTKDAIQTAQSEPEPDVAVVRGSIRDYAAEHPRAQHIALLAEVADTSLARDRYKCEIYGAEGIVAYWIVNIIDRRLEVYTEPTGADVHPGYRRRDDYGASDQAPVVIDGQEVGRVLVSDLLP